jgi:hypothetical protein
MAVWSSDVTRRDAVRPGVDPLLWWVEWELCGFRWIAAFAAFGASYSRKLPLYDEVAYKIRQLLK